MSTTIDQVKADIKSGKCTLIYYSTSSLWWTHLDSDVEESMKMGRKYMEERDKKLLADPNFPEEEKKKLKTIRKLIGKNSITPLDPSGSTLYQWDECMKWITEAEKKPEHFGKHGLDAFMKSHHQNCEGKVYEKWHHYNMLIDSSKTN